MTPETAYNQILNSQNHIFLTGNAGTGKTTLMRKFISDNEGKCIILAPTGIAVVNIGGQTIHSFCHFPARPINYIAVKRLSIDEPAEEEKLQVIRNAKYLIIDEVSMVRADLMDQLQWFFHKNTNKPWGGLRVIMVGDLDQLPPVIANDAEREMIESRYPTCFFYSATCWKENKVETIKLSKVFRQSDPTFIGILNSIKAATITDDQIQDLNEKCKVTAKLTPSDGLLVCTTNKQVDVVNSEMINRLPGNEIRLIGEAKGDFKEKDCLVEKEIILKAGCRVMIMRNGTNYANGSLGTLKALNSDGFLVVELDSGETVFIGKYTFESVAYKYDKSKDKINHATTGQFIQYPIRVAYAITIHKAQGQTFDKVIVDTGEKGAFAHGQVYVALSRCRSLEGLKLIRPIKRSDLIYDKKIMEFNGYLETL